MIQPHSYEFSSPESLHACLATAPVAYLPVGCIEFHGPHLPVGVDMLTADAICHRVAARTGGMVLPPLWLASGVLPLPYGITMPLDVVRSTARSILEQLADAGFEVLVVFSGHGALDHLHVLREETDTLMSSYPEIRALTTMWNELNTDLDGDIHDHGAKVETSLMMEFHPDLVDLTTLSEDPAATHTGIYAANPRHTASRAWGTTLADNAVTRLTRLVEGMLEGQKADSWALLEALVERLQSGDLEVVSAEQSALGLTIDFLNPHEQSKYITAIPILTANGTQLAFAGAALANPSPGEGHTDRSISELGPLSGFYVRTGQTMRIHLPGAHLQPGSYEIVASFRLADVLDIEARGSVSIGAEH